MPSNISYYCTQLVSFCKKNILSFFLKSFVPRASESGQGISLLASDNEPHLLTLEQF
jgi:hypothetical protein